MTNKSIKWVIIIVFLVLIVLIYFLPSKYRKVYDNQGQRMSGPYIITSSNPNELPDILANQTTITTEICCKSSVFLKKRTRLGKTSLTILKEFRNK